MNGELNEINPLIGVLGEPDDLYGSLDGPLTRGYSAYEIYLEHGGTMTVEEWLASLKGEKGDEPAITTQRTGSKQTTIYADGEQIGIILDGQDGDPGEPGDDGFSPTVETAAITGGHSVTITDASGPHTFNVMDGQDGAPGTDGKDGKDGSDGAPGQDGQPGADGFSPSASVTKSGKTATISITDKNGTTTATVSDGQDGQDGSDGYTPVKGTDYWTSADKAEMEQDVAEDLIADEYDPDNGTYEVGDLCTKDGALYRCKTAIQTAEAWNSSHWQNVKIADVTTQLYGDLTELDTDKADKVSNAVNGNFAGLDSNGNLTDSGKKASDFLTEAPVTDVQIDGISILNQGVANVPKGSISAFGVFKTGSKGIGVDSQGILTINRAVSSQIKAASSGTAPITPYIQHESAFYGLAEAAGDSTQSASSNKVGVYTEQAKKAICAMIGVKYEEPFRLIKEYTVTEELLYISISTDENSNPFSLQEAVIHLTGMVATGNGSGEVIVNFTKNALTVPYVNLPNMYYTNARTSIAHIQIRGGRFFGEGVDNVPDHYTRSNVYSSKNAMGIISCEAITKITIRSINDHKFTSGTITIYGR